MKNKLLLLMVLALVLGTSSAKAQNQNDIIHDLLVIANNFASPAAEGAAFQSSSGWFTSAKELGKWKVDISIQGNALFVPSGKKENLVANQDFTVLTLHEGTNALVPTVYGGTTDTQYDFSFAGQTFQIDAIDGVDKGALIHPFLQVSVGLPYGTDLAVRYLPQITIDDVEFGTFGAGLKHNLTQYIYKHPREDDFQLAVVATYTNFKVNYAFLPLDVQFAELNRIDVDANLWLAQVLGSKRYNDFEVYAGLGVTNSKFDYALAGTGSDSFIADLNNQLGGIGGTEAKFKGDLGFNYYIGDNFKVSTMFTASSFFNANLGFHYRF